MSVAEVLRLPAPRWLVQGVLQERTIGLVWGASGSGKTFFALDLCAAVARGVPWNGCRTQEAGVVYVAAEGHLKNRLQALLQARELTEKSLGRLLVVAANMNLLGPGSDLQLLIDQIQHASFDVGGVGLVVLDTLNAMMAGGDENSSQDMGAMIGAARALVEQIGCVVLFLHHPGKDPERGARGHSSLRAAVETEIAVRASGKDRRITIEKQRDGETGAEWHFRLLPVDLLEPGCQVESQDDRRSSCVVHYSDGARREPTRSATFLALDALKKAVAELGEEFPERSTKTGGMKMVTVKQWQATFQRLSGDRYKSDDVAGAAFRRERHKLVKAGRVGCAEGVAWVL